jgi:hypothetical protein
MSASKRTTQTESFHRFLSHYKKIPHNIRNRITDITSHTLSDQNLKILTSANPPRKRRVSSTHIDTGLKANSKMLTGSLREMCIFCKHLLDYDGKF